MRRTSAVSCRSRKSNGSIDAARTRPRSSLADSDGGDLWDPEADAAFVDSLRESLRPDIPFEQVDAHVDGGRPLVGAVRRPHETHANAPGQ